MNNNGKARSESHCCTKSGVDITNTPGKNRSGIATPRTHGRSTVNGVDSTNDLGKIVQGVQLYAFMADGCAEDDFAPGKRSPARQTFYADKLTILNSARFASGKVHSAQSGIVSSSQKRTSNRSRRVPIASLPPSPLYANAPAVLLEPMKNLHRILGVSSCGRRPAITSVSPDSKSLPEIWCISADNLLRTVAFHL